MGITYEAGAHEDYLISPQFTVTSGTSDRVSFYAAISGTIFTETFDVKLSTTGNTAADFTETLGSETATTSALIGNYTFYTYDLSAYNGQDVYVSIVATDTDRFYLYIDEFTVDTPPSCLLPTALNVTSLTTTSAELNWTENNMSTLWNIEWGTEGFTQGTGNLISGTSDNPFLIDALQSFTNYQFYIQTDCGGGDLSDWVGPYDFTTLAEQPQNDDCSLATTITASSDNNCNNSIFWYY